VHFLETKAIAGLPRVSKALRSEQQRVLFAAARRAGALVSCTNAFLDALQRSGREYSYLETWRSGRGGWARLGDRNKCTTRVVPDKGLELVTTGWYGGHNSGLERSFDGDEAVTLYKVTAAFSGIVIEGAANSDRAGGYALLCGPDHNATDDFIGGLQFAADDDDPSIVNLRWLYSSRQGRLSATLLPDVNPDTFYTVEAKFHYDRREADVAVDGTYAITVEYLPRPLDAIRLYNFSNCTARFREIAVSLKPGDVHSWANTAQFIQDHQHMMDALSGGSDDDSAPVF